MKAMVLTDLLGKRMQIVGDDFFATNSQRLQKGIDNGAQTQY